ncbi:glycosyltransferase [Baekduia sp. Peel2402]|uniref:glycosyltransferase n=1 Tax=Baekduia sp. Peel2402 TaxID=3458296 RepID=UPI00403E67FB
MISKIAPPADRDSGSLRQRRLIELLLADGHDVALLARDGSEPGQREAALELEAMGVEVLLGDPERSAVAHAAGRPPCDVAALLARVRPDLVWLSFYDVAEAYLPLLRAHAPGARAVVDTVDVHCVREAREAELSGRPADAIAAERTRQREVAAYGAADALIAVSDDDAAALRVLAPAVPVVVISNVHPPEPQGPGPDARDGALFVGNFRHRPNVDAALFLVGDVWPRVRAALPGARLTLAGGSPPPEVLALAGEAIEVTGWVPAIAPLLDAARVSVAPLRYGAGVKGKIGEALAHGVPVVTTTIGAEGMELVDGEHALVTDDPAGLADAIVRLHRDDTLWTALGTAGRASLEARLSPQAARTALRALMTLTVPDRFLAPAELGDAALCALLDAYVTRYAPDAAASLVFPTTNPNALLTRLLAALEALGRDPETIPDVAVTPWPQGAPAPRSIVALGDAADFAPASDAAANDLAGEGAAPRATVAVRLPADVADALIQLDALVAADLPTDVEVLALGAPAAAEDRLAALSARAIPLPADAGRRLAQLRAARHARAAVLIVLEPHALPAPGFADPLIAAVEDGATLAGPFGLRVAADGSLWPADAAPDALAFDALAATVATWRAMPAALAPRHGMAEAQLAAWATTLAHVPAARVTRQPAPPATVLICTRNRADELTDGVELLVALGAAEVLIVDNDSSDATPEIAAALAARHPSVRVIAEGQAGLSHARNAGAAAATHDLLLYLDDDARPGPGWLEALSRELSRPGVANAGGPICALWPEGHDPAWLGPRLERFFSVLDRGDADETLVPSAVVYGANWAVRREALLAAGGFDPAFGFSPEIAIGGEETGVAWRLHRHGLGATRFVAAAAVGHRIDAARLSDAYLLRRALTVGVERQRHHVALDGIDRDRLMRDANHAAARLLAHVPSLSGELTLEEALDAVGAAGLNQENATQAADHLGELSACILLLGETRVSLGALVLHLAAEHLDGRLRVKQTA